MAVLRAPSWVAPALAALLLASLLLAPLLAGSADRSSRSSPAGSRAGAQNLILFIGDGLATSYVTMARDCAGRPLALDPHLIGSSATASSDSRVTDSGAGATALASGVRSLNRAIGVDARLRPRRTILEAAEARGMSTGLVATSRVTHATPAAFAAHVARRSEESAIGLQMMRRGIEVILGGGAAAFLPSSRGGWRTDRRDLLEEARRKGVTVVSDRSGLARAGRGPLLGLFAASHMSYALDRDTLREPSLAEMTAEALERLAADRDGFFLMVEGSRIDHAGHDNDPAAAVREVLEFDAAFEVALEFARRNGRTLLVATADHETGGMSLGREVDGVNFYEWRPEVLLAARRSALAMAERIGNGETPQAVLARDAGIRDLTAQEVRAIRSAAKDQRHVPIAGVVSRRARVGWTTRGHTGVDVPVWAFGPGSERLRGARRNDELGREVAQAAGLRIGDPLP